MKVAIFSSCTTDELTVNGQKQTVPGGAGIYSSLTAKSLRFDVDLYSAVNSAARQILDDAKVSIMGQDTNDLMRFALDVRGAKRTLELVQQGPKVKYVPGNSSADAVLVSPVYNEIDSDTFNAIKSDAKFVFLDPQGFLRRTDSQGVISLGSPSVTVDGVSAIKVDDEELYALTGSDDDRLLVKAGIDHVLHTSGVSIRMLSGGRRYSLKLPNRTLGDTTGVGDIFSAAFCCTMLKEKDALWAFCFACGATSAALDSQKIGANKVPQKGKIETSAAYFYNTVEFESI